MFETMQAHNGIGLATPQVHHTIAVFVMQIPIIQEDDSWEPGQPRVFINPKIISVSEETDTQSEGCLSIPTIYEEVERPIKVRVKATDLDGNTDLHGKNDL